MRNFILITALLALSIVGFSQSVGIGTTSPSANAALHVAQGANPQGVLIPKMATADMNTLDALLVTGDEGMLIYNTDSAAFMYWDGIDFVNIAPATAGGADTDWTESGNYVLSSDSVGVGVVAPLADLDVNGRIKADSLTVNGVSYFGGGMSIAGAYDPAFSLRVYGKFKSAGLTETSDERLKEDIETVKGALEAVMQLRGVTYHWKDREQDPKLQIGLIAQELEKVYPELVDADTEGFKSVQYSKLVAVLIEGIKEQQEQINELQSKVKEIDTLKAEVEAIKAHILGTSVVK